MTTTLTPNLMTENVNQTVAFYQQHLGFAFNMGMHFNNKQPVTDFNPETELEFAMLERDGALLMTQARSSLVEESSVFAGIPIAASATFYLEVDDLDELTAMLGGEVEIIMPERTTFYGMRETWIRDNNGYVVTLAQNAG